MLNTIAFEIRVFNKQLRFIEIANMKEHANMNRLQTTTPVDPQISPRAIDRIASV